MTSETNRKRISLTLLFASFVFCLLVLTAIVISFGMTAVLVMVSLGAYLERGNDKIDIDEGEALIGEGDAE